MKHVALLALSVCAAALLVACREEEQGRSLQLKPGVYTGEKIAPLSDADRRNLRERGELQGG